MNCTRGAGGLSEACGWHGGHGGWHLEQEPEVLQGLSITWSSSGQLAGPFTARFSSSSAFLLLAYLPWTQEGRRRKAEERAKLLHSQGSQFPPLVESVVVPYNSACYPLTQVPSLPTTHTHHLKALILFPRGPASWSVTERGDPVAFSSGTFRHHGPFTSSTRNFFRNNSH